MDSKKRILFFFFNLLKKINNFIFKISKKNIFLYLNEYMQSINLKKVEILNKKLIFFCPNNIINWRLDTFFSKEPETLNWINSFKGNDIIFWDIGSNIGLYSIYSAIKHPKIKVISFEPSTSNLRVLSRNIFLNNLIKKIKICPLPLSNKKFSFSMFIENSFLEGGANSNFGLKRKNFSHNNNIYQTLGTNVNFLITQKSFRIPNFIKIDVDGIEDKILEGFGNLLKSNRIKSILVEINEKNKKQKNKILKIFKKNNFYLLKKNNADTSGITNQFYNYIFNRSFKK